MCEIGLVGMQCWLLGGDSGAEIPAAVFGEGCKQSASGLIQSRLHARTHARFPALALPIAPAYSLRGTAVPESCIQMWCFRAGCGNH